MMKDLISVIIPCYNASKTIGRTIESVQGQDYKNLEIIIVNDGSVDESVQVVNYYAEIDSRIKLINQENSGVSVARNTGLRNANGEYIVFIDADDNYTTSTVYSEAISAMKATDSDMCVFNFTHPCFEQHISEGVYDLTKHGDFLAFYQDFFASGMPWNKVRKRSTITEPFQMGVKYGEDEIFNLENLKNVHKVAVIDKVFYNYYCTPYVPMDQASAITTAFRDCKDTVWHTFMKNHPLRVSAFDNFLPDKKEEMLYIRAFDYFYWIFFLNAKNRVTEEVMNDYFQAVFKEELFKTSLKAKERYGLKLKQYTKKDLEKFSQMAYHAYRDVHAYNKKLSMYKICLGIMIKFCFEATKELDTEDIVAKTYVDLFNNSTPEAMYVNSLFESFARKNSAKNNFVLFGVDTTAIAWWGYKPQMI